MNPTKLQLDLIISTCQQETTISNDQIKQMLAMLALCMQSDPINKDSKNMGNSSLSLYEGSSQMDRIKEDLEELRMITIKKISNLDEKIEKAVQQSLS